MLLALDHINGKAGFCVKYGIYLPIYMFVSVYKEVCGYITDLGRINTHIHILLPCVFFFFTKAHTVFCNSSLLL